MKQLMDMRYDNVNGVRELIVKMIHIQTKLKSHKIDINEKFIVEHALNCLPTDFTQIKLAYNTIVWNGQWMTLLPNVSLRKRNSKKEKSGRNKSRWKRENKRGRKKKDKERNEKRKTCLL